MTAADIRPIAKNLLLFLALATLPLYIARPIPGLQKSTDFAEFYAAAKIVNAGRGHELYQSATQDEFRARYFAALGPYFNHPPFEILLYMPFAMWPPSYAQWLWCVFNVGLLFAMGLVLRQHVLKKRSWSLVLLFFSLFVPLLLDFLQGQDSVVLLFVLASTFVALKERQWFAAGCILACGLFKPHVALPVLIALLPSVGRKFLTGFVSVAAILLLLSVEVAGWGFLTAYPQFVWQSQSLPFAGIHPEQMANVRGLMVRCFPHRAPIQIGLTLAGSFLVLSMAGRGSTILGGCTEGNADLCFANVVIAATLVSYHLSPHDLTILLLPLTLIFNYICVATKVPFWMRVALIVTVAVVFLPPLDLFVLREHLYAYASLPIFILFGLTHVEIKRSAASGQ